MAPAVRPGRGNGRTVGSRVAAEEVAAQRPTVITPCLIDLLNPMTGLLECRFLPATRSPTRPADDELVDHLLAFVDPMAGTGVTETPGNVGASADACLIEDEARRRNPLERPGQTSRGQRVGACPEVRPEVTISDRPTPKVVLTAADRTYEPGGVPEFAQSRSALRERTRTPRSAEAGSCEGRLDDPSLSLMVSKVALSAFLSSCSGVHGNSGSCTVTRGTTPVFWGRPTEVGSACRPSRFGAT